MKYSETLVALLKKYLVGKLSDPEREQLFILQQDEGADDIIKSELYIAWKDIPAGTKDKNSGDSFHSVKEKLGISEEKLRQDRLILDGIRHKESKSGNRNISVIVKYAAAVVLLLVTGWILGLVTDRAEVGTEMGFNEIVVPNGSKIRVSLPDSTEVWLNSGSTLRYNGNFGNQSREVYLEGEAFFDVTENPARPFFVRTTDIDIKVLGTRFNVKSYPDEDIIETTLVSGKIEILETKGKQSAHILQLNPDQKAYYSKRANAIQLQDKSREAKPQPSAIRPTSVVKLHEVTKQEEEHIEIKWKDNQLIFRDEPLETLARKLERWYGVEISLEDRAVARLRFTGTIANETVEQAMNAFVLASSIDYDIDQNKIRIWKSRK